MRTPTYLVKNNNGIYYFRYVIPIADAHLFPKNRREIRRSLKTRVRSEALKRARFYWVKMTELKITRIEQDIYADNDQVQRGNEILRELEQFKDLRGKLYDYEEFITQLSNDDIYCLELASKHQFSKSKQLTVTSPRTVTADGSNQYPPFVLKDLFATHLKEKGALESKTVEGYTRHFELFLRITDAITTTDITPKILQHYKATLPQLPPRLQQDKAFTGKTINQILAMTYPKPMAFKTVKEKFVAIRAFLKWLSLQEYVEKDLSPMLGNIKNPSNKKDSEHRAVFTESDLNKLFSTPEYQSDGFKGYSFRYWVPLLALYTGARSNELSQLHVTDVYESEGVLVIDINSNNNKKLKTVNAVRKIPVHRALIKLGFNDFVDTVKGRNELKLFPPLKPDGNKNCARKVSSFFNASYKKHIGYLDYCGIPKHSELGSKVFHSFRHTFLNQWKQQYLDPNIIKQVAGHSSNDLTTDTYGKDFPLSEARKELNKINFKLDISPVKWRKTFY